jgi:signal transduction histidine kinase
MAADEGREHALASSSVNCLAERGSDAGPMRRDRRRTKEAYQRGTRLTGQGQAHPQDDIRLEERCRERARIGQELLASMLLDQALEQTAADSPVRSVHNRALHMVRRAVDEGRAAKRGIQATSPAPSSLEGAFSSLLSEVALGGSPRVRLFVQGTPGALNPAIQEQLFMIGREAVMNALRHSEATDIEVEVRYPHDVLLQ